MSDTPKTPEYYEELDKMELFADDSILKIARGEVANFVTELGAQKLRDDLEFSQKGVEDSLQPFFTELFQILPTATVVETSGGEVAFFKEFLTPDEERRAYMISICKEGSSNKVANIEPNLTAKDAVS
ncbi:hypothetical protein BH11PAT4_BH11PAT4_1810 [soil metagenome]